MRVIDLTYPLDAAMPLFPGTPAPVIEDTATIAADGFREKRIALCTHTGTHIDAPAHILAGGRTLDRLPVETFVGQAVLADCSDPGRATIGLDDLTPLADAVRDCEFLILRTGWHRFWGQARYFSGFPVLSRQAAEWLAGRGLRGVGIDTLSVDPLADTDLPIHHILLSAGLVIVENLANLDAVPESAFLFSCLPMKIRDADGSPVRAVAVLT